MIYDIEQGEAGKSEYTAYGGVLDFIGYKGPEAIISGPAETGKTLGALWKLHLCASKYKNSSIVICRKTLTSTYSTVLITFQKKVLGENSPVKVYGGEKPQWFDYPNGSRIWVAGLDKVGKVLSAEHDMILVNQPEELSLAEWETLTTRTTGRAGNMPYAQTIGDMNPAWPTHWVYRRDSLKMFYSHHRENPLLYDQETGGLTAQGRLTMAVLDALTGVRRTRLRDGKAAQAEGAIYPQWDQAVHLIDPFPIPDDWRRFRVVDFGYTNPFVCQWYAVDSDGRLLRYREIYMTQRTVRVHAERINALSEGEYIEVTICDHDAEDRATLAENGIPTVAADKAVTRGIQAVQERLKVQRDGKPRIFLFRDALVEPDEVLVRARKPICTEEEIDAYAWAKGVDGKAAKEHPMKVDDHGMDGMRYGVMYLDGGHAGTGKSAIIKPVDVIAEMDKGGF